LFSHATTGSATILGDLVVSTLVIPAACLMLLYVCYLSKLAVDAVVDNLAVG
jgi:hypothetical protein